MDRLIMPVSSAATSRPPGQRLDSLVLEVLEVLFRDPLSSIPPRLSDHTQCSALSACLRGKLCTRLDRGPGETLAAGAKLYMTGSRASSVYLLQSGVIKTSVVSASGQEFTIRIYTSGEILGELCLCEGERRDQATALEPSQVIEIPLAVLLVELRRDPEAALELASLICERLGEAYGQLHSLSADPVMARLVQVLLKLAADLGEVSPAGILIGGRITQEELGKLIGAGREVVSRLLNRLRSGGLISYSPRGPITVHAAALQSFLKSITEE